MKSVLAAFAMLALLPAMTRPLPVKQSDGTLTFALCGGGTITIPVNAPPPPGSGGAPCCAKGCHSSGSRKRLDQSQ